MCKIISVISCKGGVGKTTSTVNISSYIQMNGKRVCVVDLDPQHNLSKHFGIHPGQIANQPTIYDLFNAAINETMTMEGKTTPAVAAIPPKTPFLLYPIKKSLR